MWTRLSDGAQITEAQIRAAHPETRYPIPMPDEVPGYQRTVITPMPLVGDAQKAVRDGVELLEGKWRTKWLIVDKTTDEVEAEQFNIARAYESLLEDHVDGVARGGVGLLTFKNSESAVSYTDDSDPYVAACSQAFKAWRSAFWTGAAAIKAEVIAGVRPMPSLADALAELPTMEWPLQ